MITTTKEISPMDTYSEAHLFVAAIRVLEHRQKRPPMIEDVSEMIGISSEEGHALCRKMQKIGAVVIIEAPYSLKLTVADHLQLETLARVQPQQTTLAKELEEFQAKKKNADRKTADIYTELEKKKREMLSDIEEKFKKEMNKHTKS